MPMRPAMACRGRWRATSSTKSPVPSRLAAHTIRWACSRRSSSSPARARGVKHRLPTLRTRVCRGGSMQSRRFLVDSPVGSDSSSRRTKAELRLHRPPGAPRHRRDIGVAGDAPRTRRRRRPPRAAAGSTGPVDAGAARRTRRAGDDRPAGRDRSDRGGRRQASWARRRPPSLTPLRPDDRRL